MYGHFRTDGRFELRINAYERISKFSIFNDFLTTDERMDG